MVLLKNWWLFGLASVIIGAAIWVAPSTRPSSPQATEAVDFPTLGRMVEVTFDSQIALDDLAEVPMGSFVLDQNYNPAKIDNYDIPSLDYYQLSNGDLLILTRSDNDFLQVLHYSAQNQHVALKASLNWNIAKDLGAVFMDEGTIALYGNRYGDIPSTNSTMATISNVDRWDWILARWDFNRQTNPEVIYVDPGGLITSGLKTNRRADKWFAERADSHTLVIQTETINGNQGSYLATSYICDLNTAGCDQLDASSYHFPQYRSTMYVTEKSLSACSNTATNNQGKIWYATPSGVYRLSIADKIEYQVINEAIYPEYLYFLESKSNQCTSPAQDKFAYLFNISSEELTKINQPIWGDLEPRELFWANWSAEPPLINGNLKTYIEQDVEAITKNKTWLANAPWTTWIKTTDAQILFIGGWRWAAFIPTSTPGLTTE